ncbi:MAG: ribosome maturation factor RimM [Prevotella sp.]|nr:ribosome maturation factor RimM [Prevotella sp.]MDY5667464.1 ribosome maturation factor RimM [Alloprevotella sp.]
MIRESEVFKIGYIAKHRGLRGEVELSFTDDCFDTGSAEYLVLDMDGILVPFFWEEYRFKNDDTAIIKFEDVDTDGQARRLVGHSVYYPKAHLADVDSEEGSVLSSYKSLTGFAVSNQDGQYIGTIVQVDDSSANVLLTIEENNGEELMLPFHNDFLLNYDLRERTLQLYIPEELLNLNR